MLPGIGTDIHLIPLEIIDLHLLQVRLALAISSFGVP